MTVNHLMKVRSLLSQQLNVRIDVLWIRREHIEWVNDGSRYTTLLNTRIGAKSWCILQVVNKAGSIPVTGATAPIVEWLAHISDKDEMEVQFFLGVQNGKQITQGVGPLAKRIECFGSWGSIPLLSSKKPVPRPHKASKECRSRIVRSGPEW